MSARTPDMARRRNTSDNEDEVQLISQDEDEDHDPQSTVSSTSSSSSGIEMKTVQEADNEGPPPRVGDEHHFTPPPRSAWKKLQSKRYQLACWWATLVILSILCILAIAVPLGVWENRPKQRCLDFEDVSEEDYEAFPYLFSTVDSTFTLCKRGEMKLEGRLGKGRASLGEFRVDYWNYTHNSNLNITRTNKNCLRIEWQGETSIDNPLTDCFKIGTAQWYGAYEVYTQTWPIDWSYLSNLTLMPFLPGDYLADSSQDVFGPVVHPLWLSSNGTGIFVDKGTHLHVSFNASTMEVCLHALPYELECIPHSSNYTTLDYTVCIFNSLADTTRYFLDNMAHPNSTPSRDLFEKPIWSTWAEYKDNINGAILNDSLDNIISRGFPISQLEIDDGYSAHYGELEFNSNNFTDDDLMSLSQRVNLTAWVHPFVSVFAQDFISKSGQCYFLPGCSETKINSVSLVKWWHDYAAVINYINSTIAKEHNEALDAFVRRYSLISLKFDAGEATYIPKCTHIEGLYHPADYANAYVRFVGDQEYANRAEVRVGYFTQDVPVFVRILDRNSRWGLDNGLQSVLTAVLAMGIGGYPFVLPDVIGGNDYAGDSDEELGSELYVRWAQLSAFLPAMQFSIPPWRFGDKVKSHVQQMVELHQSLTSDVIFNLTERAAKTNYPIIRPLWWLVDNIDDEQPAIWNIHDQFLIGDAIMVAPILTKGATNRTVYFPQNTKWKKAGWPPQNDNKVYCYSTTDQRFDVGLYETLYFTRVTDNEEKCSP